MLSCVGDGPIERDRDAEFAALPTWAELRPRFVAFLASAEALLDWHDHRRLAAISRHPAGDRMNRRCLTHTIEHLGLHLGHVEVTIDWWKATQSMMMRAHAGKEAFRLRFCTY